MRATDSYREVQEGHRQLVEEHRLALAWLYDQVQEQPVQTAVEYFAGIGIASRIIRERWPLRKHLLLEKDPACVQLLQTLITPSTDVVQLDSLPALGTHRADLVSLDFSTLTPLGIVALHSSFKRLFLLQPLVVDLTVTQSRLGLHRARWAALLGSPVHSPEDYWKALSAYFLREFGYGVAAVATHGNSVHLALLPGRQDMRIYQVPRGA